MENKVKEWIKKEYDFVKDCNKYSVEKATDRCYGVLMFAINSLFDEYNEELGQWWDDEMLPKFRELERR